MSGAVETLELKQHLPDERRLRQAVWLFVVQLAAPARSAACWRGLIPLSEMVNDPKAIPNQLGVSFPVRYEHFDR